MKKPAFISIHIFILGFAIVTAVSGCGGGSSMAPNTGNSPATASIRIAQQNASAGNTNVMVDSATIASNLTYLTNTGYMMVSTDSKQLTLQFAGGLKSAIQPLNLSANSHTTFILDGWCCFDTGSVMLMDDTTPPANSGVKLRIVDAALSSTAVDAYVLPAGGTPSGSPTIAGMSFNAASSYLALAAGNYDVFFTVAGSPAQVLFHTGAITLGANQNRTLAVLNDCTVNTCDLTGHTLRSITLADLN